MASVTLDSPSRQGSQGTTGTRGPDVTRAVQTGTHGLRTSAGRPVPVHTHPTGRPVLRDVSTGTSDVRPLTPDTVPGSLSTGVQDLG